MKVFLDTVGCRLNQSEIEKMGQQFRAAGHELVADAAQADLAVINTCAVTNEAAADSRQKIRAAARAGAGEVVPTGCWVTMDPKGAAALPGVRQVFPNPVKDNLTIELLRQVGAPLVPVDPGLGELEVFDLEPLAREPLPGARLRTRAFIKVQDGCDNRCTFCVTTLLRGDGQSRGIEEVLQDVYAAAAGGVQEIVLTGVHLGSWGQDFPEPAHLKQLIQTILRRTAHLPGLRVRLSSLEPWDLEEDFFDLWRTEPRLCRHLHLPLQAGCDATLRRMARKTTQASFTRLVQAARSACPEIAITTDLIAGFPGETEAEFAETLAFVQALQFAGGHVFTYSERPGTAAARMPNQVPHPLRKQRSALLRAAIGESAAAYQARFVGATLPVLWENTASLGPQGWQMSGLTDNYLRVAATASQDLWNTITPVHILDENPQGLTGVVSL